MPHRLTGTSRFRRYLELGDVVRSPKQGWFFIKINVYLRLILRGLLIGLSEL